MTAELIGLAVSPYSEKAKWALDHHSVPYRYSEHLIIFGMPALRLKTHRYIGDVTVPVLIDGDNRLLDSFDIARFADERGTSTKLFPLKHEAELKRYRQLSEEGLDAGRALILPRLGSNKNARRESIPAMFPKVLNPIMLPLVSVGIDYLCREFSVDAGQTSKHEKRLREVLHVVRADLKKSGGDYLLGSFSFADILMAVVVQFVEPVADRYVHLGPATRECMTTEKLRAEFADLIAWRDRLYTKHRGTS